MSYDTFLLVTSVLSVLGFILWVWLLMTMPPLALGMLIPMFLFGNSIGVDIWFASTFVVIMLMLIIGHSLNPKGLSEEELKKEQEEKRKAKAREAALKPQNEWREKFQVYLESEILKGASRKEAALTAHELAGPSPVEHRARIEAERKERLAREAAERAEKEERERLRREKAAQARAAREKIQHDLEILEKRARLDKERQLEEAERAKREAWRAARKKMNTPTKRILQQYATDPDRAGWKAAPTVVEQTESEQEPESSFLVAEYAWLDAFLQGERDVQCDALPGNEWWRYSVGGEVFAVLHIPVPSHAASDNEDFVDEAHPLLTVRCKPDLGEYLQSEYTGILPAEYAEGNTWVVINLDGSVTKDLIRVLSAASYGMARV